MNSISFNKTRYHQQQEMISWCEQNIGKGRWTYASPITWEGLDDRIWTVWSQFGNTTFDFKHPEHLVLFKLRWS